MIKTMINNNLWKKRVMLE